MPQNQPSYADLLFLRGGSQMGELIRSIDWRANPLGPPDNWSAALKHAVSMMLRI